MRQFHGMNPRFLLLWRTLPKLDFTAYRLTAVHSCAGTWTPWGQGWCEKKLPWTVSCFVVTASISRSPLLSHNGNKIDRRQAAFILILDGAMHLHRMVVPFSLAIYHVSMSLTTSNHFLSVACCKNNTPMEKCISPHRVVSCARTNDFRLRPVMLFFFLLQLNRESAGGRNFKCRKNKHKKSVIVEIPNGSIACAFLNEVLLQFLGSFKPDVNLFQGNRNWLQQRHR